jgi:hypothetical protein
MKRNASDSFGSQSFEQGPPLRSWIAFMIIVAGLAVLSTYAFMIDETDPEICYDRARLASLNRPAGPGTKKIVAVGTSLLACATYFDDHMDEFSWNSGTGRVRFLRITRPSVSINQLAPLLENILDARPDILILERNILFYHYYPSVGDLAARHSDFLRRKIKGIAAMYTGPQETLNDMPVGILDRDEDLERVPFRRGALEWKEYKEVRTRFTGPGRYVDRKITEDFIDIAHKQNIKVILVDFPRTADADTLILKSDRQLIDSYTDLYKRLYGVRYLHFPEELPLEYFRDYSHLNFKGRELFSAWLLTEILNTGFREGL